MLDQGKWTLTRQRPDLAQNWLQTNEVFVNGSELDDRLGEVRRHLAQQRTLLLLEVGLGM